MRSLKKLAGSAGLAAVLIVSASPAWADGKADRARQAVAEARAKVDAMNKLNGAGDFPRMQAEAQATLRTAEEDLAGMSKDKAIADANRASQLADTAIGLAQRNQAEAAAAQQQQTQMNAQAATQAQQDAADANARAAEAQQAAAQAQAEAVAARNQPPVVVPVPVQAETTVTTQTTRSATATRATPRKVVHRVVKKPVRRAAAPTRVAETTTTTVTTR